MVTLIATTYNAEEGLEAWCESIVKQTRKPDEVIIVDGGSTDRTLDILRKYPFRVIYRPDLNTKYHKSPVAAGRNVAIQEAENGIICVTDAGCVLSQKWIERIVEPFRHEEVEVVGGAYSGMVTNPFSERVSLFMSRNSLPVTEFSSRSIAFRKRLWALVGGYPEVSLTGEDTLFNQAIKGAKSAFAQEAVVFWHSPRTWREFARLQYRYALGDGYSLIRRASYAKIAGKYAVAVLLTLSGLWWVAVLGLTAILWKQDVELKVVSDVSKTLGYARGILSRLRDMI